jgi:hypothetical protein
MNYFVVFLLLNIFCNFFWLKIVKLAEDLENGCLLLGATGVEDKLQDSVPEKQLKTSEKAVD